MSLLLLLLLTLLLLLLLLTLLTAVGVVVDEVRVQDGNTTRRSPQCGNFTGVHVSKCPVHCASKSSLLPPASKNKRQDLPGVAVITAAYNDLPVR